MNNRMPVMTTTLFLVMLMLCGCSTVSSPSPAYTTGTPTDTPLPSMPIPTYEPGATPEPFTSPVTSGVWSGQGSIALPSGDQGELQLTLLVAGDGKTLSRWELGFAHCSQIVGGAEDIPIEGGVFSIELDDPCGSGEKVIIEGVFASATKLIGSVMVGSSGGEWTAVPK